jgi:hypothetical protein
MITELLERFETYDRTRRLKWIGPTLINDSGDLIRTKRGYSFYEYRNCFFCVDSNNIYHPEHIAQFCKRIDQNILAEGIGETPEEKLIWLRENTPYL